MPNEVWYEITYLFRNPNDAIIEDGNEWLILSHTI